VVKNISTKKCRLCKILIDQQINLTLAPFLSGFPFKYFFGILSVFVYRIVPELTEDKRNYIDATNIFASQNFDSV